MQHLDLQVVKQVVNWLSEQQPVWFCTVLATYGSSPREPGSLFAARSALESVGSLSGGCVEENFLERLAEEEFSSPVTIVRYGDTGDNPAGVTLPCGGVLSVLVEKITPGKEALAHFQQCLDILQGTEIFQRQIRLTDGSVSLTACDGTNESPVIWQANAELAKIRIGPSKRLIIAGISPVSVFCAQYALSLGFDVVVCDARSDVIAGFMVPGCRVEQVFPADFILAEGNVHEQTAIVALTHDPRIDDTAVLDALETRAFYIGVMGSKRTSAKRAERLQRLGQISNEELQRIHMPIGIDIGSKTPAEIALSVMADIVKAFRLP